MNTLILLPLYNQPSFKEKLQLVISYIKFSMKNNSIGERESKIIVLTPLQEDLDIHFNIKQNVVIESVYVDEKNTRYICKKHKISNVLFFPDCAVSLDLILKNLRWFKKQNISMLNNYHYNIKYIKDISQMRSILEINNYIKKKWSIDTFIAQENILNHKRKYKSFFLLNNENFCLIGMLGTKQVTQSKHNIVNLPSHTQNTLYNILNFVSKIIAIQNWVITLEFIFDDEIFYISNISLEYNADLVNLCLQFGFNINNLLSNILNGNNLTISQLAHNQIAHIPYCYNQEVNNLDFHQDEVIRNNLVNTLNKNYHSGLKQICVQKITDIIYQIDNFHSTKYQITRLQSANKLLLVFFEYTGFSSLLSLNKIIDYIKSKYEIEIIIITTPKAVSFISGINNVSYIFSINLNVTNIQTFYNQFSNVYNRSKIFTLVMQRFFAKEWIELIETLHNQFVGISAESIRLLYSDSFISIEKEDNEMFKKMTLNNSINVERFEAYLFVDNNVNLVGVYQVLNSLDTTGNNYSFKTTSILHSKRYIYDQIINRLNNIIGKYSAVGLYKILFSYSNGELYWEQTRHSFDLSLAKVLSETGCAYSLMLDIFINCIYNNAKIAQNSDIRYADNIYKYSSVICYSPYYMINGTMYNNFANSNIVQHSGTALKAINMMWQYMKYNNIDYQDGKKCIIINAEMKNIKYIPALYRNIKASNYYDVIYFTNQDVIHYLKQKYGINDIAIFLQEKNIDKIKETIKLVISLGKSDWLDEYVYKKYLPIARNYYEALFYIDAMITGSLNEKDRKVLL